MKKVKECNNLNKIKENLTPIGYDKGEPCYDIKELLAALGTHPKEVMRLLNNALQNADEEENGY